MQSILPPIVVFMLLSDARARPQREDNLLKRGFNQAETVKAAFDELKKDAQFALDYKNTDLSINTICY